MKFLKEKDKQFQYSFSREELKIVFTSLDLIYKGMPKTDLSLLAVKSRLKKMIKLFREKLEETTPTIITK